MGVWVYQSTVTYLNITTGISKKGWRRGQVLKVYFMNPDDIDVWGWKCRGDPLNIITIFAWARVWNIVQIPEIPYLEMSELAKNSDIRVQFSSNQL